MSTQYQLLTQMLSVLKLGKFCFNRMSRVECLVYRLKLALLTNERIGGNHNLDAICPVASLERMLQLLNASEPAKVSDQLVLQVEEGLLDLIQSLTASLKSLPARGTHDARPCTH